MRHSHPSTIKPTVACLIVSRTPILINRLLSSLPASRRHWCERDQVLCSWNGTYEAEQDIRPPEVPAFQIACRDPYDFSSNINALAKRATSDYVCLLNDDVVLDPGSLDNAVEILQKNPDIGIIGGKLRTTHDTISHAGILLTPQGLPYNRLHPDQLGDLIDHTSPEAQLDGQIPAVTAALMVLRRQDLLDVPMRTTFDISGQDVALCLDIWQYLRKTTFYSSEVTAIHNERTTRGFTSDLADRERVGHIARSLGEHPANWRWLYSQSEFFFNLLLESERRFLHHSKEADIALSAAQAEIEALRSSTSWLITQPMRTLVSILKQSLSINPAARSIQLNILNSADAVSGDSPDDVVHIIFDTLILGHARLAKVSRGGIYRYASELLKGLGKLTSGPLIGYCSDPIYARDSAIEAALTCGREPTRSRPHLSPPTLPAPLKAWLKPIYRRCIKLWIPRSRSFQRATDLLDQKLLTKTIYHTPFLSVPEEIRNLQPQGVLVTIHDLIPLIYPEFFTRETIKNFKLLLSCLQPTDHVVCVSRSTKSDFQRFLPEFPESHIHVTHLAASPLMRPVLDFNKLSSLRARLGLHNNERIILSLCTLEPRKNLARLVQAFELLLQSSSSCGYKLVLAGSLGWKADPLSDLLHNSPARNHVLLTGHIDDHDLPTLYSIAEVFVYPSLYEGFGLPPLEAMQCGTPVIVGHNSSLSEVVGQAGVLIDVSDTNQIATAIADLMNNKLRRDSLKEAGLRQAELFSWDYTAQQTLDIYEYIINS